MPRQITNQELAIAKKGLTFYPGFKNTLTSAYQMTLAPIHKISQRGFLNDYLNTHLNSLQAVTGINADVLLSNIELILELEPIKTDSDVSVLLTNRNNTLYTVARVFNTEIDFILDTGCSTTMMNYSFFKDQGFLDQKQVAVFQTQDIVFVDGTKKSYPVASGVKLCFGGLEIESIKIVLTDGPNLLGNDVLSKFKSYKICNVNNLINLNK